jgi:hypothetical protein
MAGGRPSKYTDETVARVVEGIKLGLTYELAASYAGISWDTFDRWRKGKADFALRISEAEGKGAALNMARINKEAQEGEWRAAAWIMEHRHGYASSADLTLKGDFTHTVNLKGVDPEDV